MLISENVGFRTNEIKRCKREYYIMIKGPIQQKPWQSGHDKQENMCINLKKCFQIYEAKSDRQKQVEQIHNYCLGKPNKLDKHEQNKQKLSRRKKTM